MSSRQAHSEFHRRTDTLQNRLAKTLDDAIYLYVDDLQNQNESYTLCMCICNCVCMNHIHVDKCRKGTKE